jgi:glyoxylase-like metal-dependent hydrolase (beta-lactamase superfamily II)
MVLPIRTVIAQVKKEANEVVDESLFFCQDHQLSKFKITNQSSYLMQSIKVSAIKGNTQRLDGGAMFGNAPRAVWEKWISPDDRSRIELNCRAMLLEIGDKRILCETGIGAFFEPKLADRYGVVESSHRLIENLLALGFKDSDIDFVILSHLHFDHAGGLLPSWAEQQQGKTGLLFPNAKYVVGKTAFSRAENPHTRDRASFIPGLCDKLKTSGRLILVDGNQHPDVLPNYLSFVFTEGHTPGHMHTIAKSNKSAIAFAGDLIPGRAWIHLPITMGYDRYPEMLIDEKKSFYDRFANENSWIFFTHDHEFAMSRVRLDSSHRYTAYDDIADPVHFVI